MVHIRLFVHNIVDKSEVCLCGRHHVSGNKRLNIGCVSRCRNCVGDVNTKTTAFTKLVLLLREVQHAQRE